VSPLRRKPTEDQRQSQRLYTRIRSLVRQADREDDTTELHAQRREIERLKSQLEDCLKQNGA
jgi:hypothetical protein